LTGTRVTALVTTGAEQPRSYRLLEVNGKEVALEYRR
jgi:hypothetical protein